jgi:hypothetical protein
MSRGLGVGLKTMCIAVALSAAAAAPALAADRHWNVGSGLWTSSGNWSPAAVPQPADNAIVDFWDFSRGVGGEARINTKSVSAITAGTVTNGAAISMTGTLDAGSLLVGTDLVLGTDNLHGTLNVTNANPFVVYTGGITVVQSMRLGVNSGVGTVNQNAGTVVVGNSVILGDTRLGGSIFNPAGVYNLSGGLLRTGSVEIGAHANSNGTFNLSGFGLTNIQNYFDVGGQGIGAVNQTGGTNSVGALTIGSFLVTPPPGQDVYTMSGGSLVVNGITDVTKNGVFNYNGGDTWLGHLHLNSNGQININAGTLKSYTCHFYDPAATIDVKGNTMEVSFADIDHRDTLTDALRRGYNGGAWTGNGVRSSVAAANAGAAHRTAVGLANVANVGFRMQYTYSGDANLDRKVDLTDFTTLAANFNQSTRFWYDGDFNYDGTVNLTDFTLLASNFNQTMPSSSADIGVTVPEPASLTSPGVISALISGRRRRRS